MGTFGGITTTIPSFPGSGTFTPLTPVHGGSVSVGSTSGVPLSSTLNSGLTLVSLLGFLLDLLLLLFVFSLIGVLVIIVVSNRADPDPSGRRPQAVYYFAVSFVTLAVTVIASAVVVSGIDALVGHHSNAVTNAAARAILVGLLAVVMAGALLVVHLRRGLDLVRHDTQPPAPSRRVGQSYVSSVAFVSVLSLLGLFVFSVYTIFSLVAPGVFGTLGSQGNSAHVLVVAIYLWLVAWVVLETHRRLVSPELDIFGSRRMAQSETPPAQDN